MRYIIGVGAQKAGTTWLADYFRQHPQVHVPIIKEVHFFDTVYRPDLCAGFEHGFLQRYQQQAQMLKPYDIRHHTEQLQRQDELLARLRMGHDMERYRAFFSDRMQPGEIMACDITPAYALLDEPGFQAMARLSPDLRIIFLLRNPVDRFWSALRMWGGQRPNMDIDTALEQELRNPQHQLRGDYPRTLALLRQHFPEEQIHVEFFEALFTPESIQRICTFCGIDYLPPATDKIIGEGKPYPLAPEQRQRIRDHLRPIYGWAETNFGQRLPARWRQDMED
ncbi:sulfotransferase [Ectothiorhodospira lacustris]|uniref:sulfotransferase n=1 Tax=Ectothiorhodospira lacustris TaxID=2899127 RepID=UPI001EE79C7C|nr:sulfotransferase [Ectothiorhodospira lacustris]MCG5500821.1 sulfotransferase [Ectothiorhodospira lacustris]